MRHLLMAVTIILLFATSGMAEKKELLMVPDIFRGVWIVQGYSEDKGNTMDDSTNGAAYCRMGATSVLTFDGLRIPITRVLKVEEKGVDYFILTLKDRNVYWILCNTDGTYIMMQVMDYDHTEKSRSLFTVMR